MPQHVACVHRLRAIKIYAIARRLIYMLSKAQPHASGQINALTRCRRRKRK